MLPELSAIPPFYWLVLCALVVAALLGRLPVIGGAVRLVTLGSTILLVVIAFSNQQQSSRNLDWLARSPGMPAQQQLVVGDEVRVPMSPDGHFWVEARIEGVERRLLVDSGATLTALSSSTAAAAQIPVTRPVVPVVLRTANGTITPDIGTIAELRFGSIVARNLNVVVSPAFGDTDIIGMNFLSRLKSWRVEGRTLILVPNNPQPTGGN